MNDQELIFIGPVQGRRQALFGDSGNWRGVTTGRIAGVTIRRTDFKSRGSAWLSSSVLRPEFTARVAAGNVPDGDSLTIWRVTLRLGGGEVMVWVQHLVTLPAQGRGLHLITHLVVSAIPELPSLSVGLLHVFVQHTSASLTLNENADPDVRVDLDYWLNVVAPETLDYAHTLEGADDMPAHIKSSLMGSDVTIPVRDGRLALGTWQGIYLCEHRNHPTQRHLVLTLQGEGGN